MTNTSDVYDEKYLKTKFHSDGNLLLKKILKLQDLIIVVSAF